ncbi:hypothetical protein [Paenibacillus sp. OV219]|uniref:hypothetical protein n=1 Tax=Paenibacillus sp. OV219 TaxID=1884377 RepID=UPI0008BC432A|nr:hypothetical protein [Paenibacillus sp. OV219]SEM78642.1 hypothetical protein SAMN05518847_101790 [Paenibacillus sp. OV219]
MRKVMCILQAVCLLGISIMLSSHRAEAGDEGAKLRVAASPESVRATELAIGSDEAISKMLSHGVRVRIYAIPVTDTFVTFKKGSEESSLPVDRYGVVYDTVSHEKLILQEPDRVLLSQQVRELRGAHYGRLLPWEEAKVYVPNMSSFSLTDLETGLTFQVQRRAGSSHADVQPLTREDTEIMKRIYNGKWSWKRKAILVQADGQVLAASMHGKPHGGDGIPDNDFPGHFCVHFLGSTTHKTQTVDPEHQLMVFKAAGKLPEYVGAMNPDKIVATFFKTFNLKEIQASRMLFEAPYNDKLERLIAHVERIAADQKKVIAANASEDELIADLSQNVRMLAENKKVLKLKLGLILVRESPAEPWKIESIAAIDNKGKDMLDADK